MFIFDVGLVISVQVLFLMIHSPILTTYVPLKNYVNFGKLY